MIVLMEKEVKLFIKKAITVIKKEMMTKMTKMMKTTSS